jgi:IstB-like ATP binding protein
LLRFHRAFKEWPTIFNHDSTLTSAVLDRLLHHADTIIIEGKSFRRTLLLDSRVVEYEDVLYCNTSDIF